MHIWGASLDMQKAFDRVEHHAIFDALRYFEIDEGYLALIHMMYEGQTGTMDGLNYFEISRGVRQGDVLSMLLLNADLDFAFNKWKNKLNNYGWRI
eukprot:8770392-Karenia_brevis.AAC.1